jgi:hypothetical protein
MVSSKQNIDYDLNKEVGIYNFKLFSFFLANSG